MNGSELGERARPERDLYTVSRLNVEVRSLLEDSFPPLWVEGEISNLARPRSGHLYFSLKDDAAQVRCAMFRMHNRRLDFDPGDGVHVVVHARVSLYAERGDFQLIVHHMEEAGAGALRRAFEALKRKLAAEGLFDPERKRELPALPSRIGVVTSPTGAALRDVLSVLKRRFPAIPVLIYPTPVQGGEAAAAIERAVELAGKRADCDVLLLTRGGGSLEDLWPFNEERVARALAACPIPIVTGIGHEVDFTIADLVADRRAATPSAAAELVSPDASSWRERRDAALRRLRRVARGRLREERQALAWLLRRVIHPRRRLAELRGRHRELGARLDRAARAVLLARRQRLSAVQAQLARHDPSPKLGTLRRDATTLLQRMRRALDRRVGEHRQRLASLMRALEGVSPSRTLERGYAIVTRDSDGSVLRDADDVARGDSVQARLARGRVRCEVLASEPEP